MDKTEIKRTVVLILPFLLFLLAGSCEALGSYHVVYMLKILAVTFVTLVLFRKWLRMFPLHVTRWTLLALALGVCMTSVWVLLAKIPADFLWGTSAPRAAFNPFEFWSENHFRAWCFWGIRMFGLALVVPLIEEMFLRGFFLRYIYAEFSQRNAPWHEVPVGALGGSVWLALWFYAGATHPELFAALAWFSIVTLYVNRTRNLWDAVAMHVGTNAGLGIYVLLTGTWGLM